MPSSSSSSSPNVNMSVIEKSKTSKKENDKRRYKKSNDSGGENSAGDNDNDNDNDKSDSESIVHRKKGRKNKSNPGKRANTNATGGPEPRDKGQEEFDMQEYRKMLAGMFPSKYTSKRVNTIENTRERAVESICKDLNLEKLAAMQRGKFKVLKKFY